MSFVQSYPLHLKQDARSYVDYNKCLDECLESSMSFFFYVLSIVFIKISNHLVVSYEF